MSIPPNWSTALATAAATESPSRTSPTIGSAWPPASSISLAAVYMVPGSLGWGSAVLATSAMFAPSAATRLAIDSPIPRLAPEMNMVFPVSVIARPYLPRLLRRTLPTRHNRALLPPCSKTAESVDVTGDSDPPQPLCLRTSFARIQRFASQPRHNQLRVKTLQNERLRSR